MFAATAAGLYPKVEDAMTAIGRASMPPIQPDPAVVAIYSCPLPKIYTASDNYIESRPP